MGLKRMLNSKWFTRLVMISSIICAGLNFVIFKNMELIVHGQLYSYGLILSPDWADPYRIYTWLLLICLGLPMAFSGVALVSSFFKVEKVPERSDLVQQRPKPPQGIVKLESPPTVKKAPKRVNGVNVGISCPHCKKVFSRALVMLDFHGGKHQLVSVCPYCNHVLGNSEEKETDKTVHVARPDEKIIY